MRRDWMGIIQQKEDGSEILNYNDESFPVYLYQGWIEPGVTWAEVAHFHDELEIMTVTRGEIGYNVNGEELRLHEGETLIVNSRQIHFSIPVNECRETYNLCIIHPSLLCGCCSIADRYVKPVVGNPSIPYILLRNGTEPARQMYKESFNMIGCMGDNFDINAQFFNMWKIVIKYCKNELHLEDEETDSNPAIQSIKKMMNFCRTNYDKPITLDDIAKEGGVSRTYCNRLFHKYTGRSPMDSLMRERAEKTAEYLAHSDMTMAEIADRTGFAGASYMAEIFKRYYKMSPREYRRASTMPDAQK